ncbi:hypothetical protein L914_03214 [Phytophthora nicotianae]|uniref:Major capsid protein n=1 Tax=Phytophthora nicotianae TaxID=4792 RepID=W2NX50_PHYNI|nr:hypothetical protein L914_03214 [Phytophthora nicotianae]
MSTASDISAFEHSVEPAPAETLFRDKKWTYIQDSTSNTGQYAGQIQFNLSTISSQAAFVNWQEAVIELPIKLQILNGGSGTLTTAAAASNVGEFGLANTVVNKGARDRAAFATVDQSAAKITSIYNNMNFGNTCPILYNLNSANGNASYAAANGTGLSLPASICTLNITADANGTPTQGTNITPSQAFSRLLVPTYSPNPSADNALIQKKTFRYFERVTNKFTVLPNQSFTWTVSNGIANPKKLILQPIITNPVSNTANSTNAAYADVINPFRSPLSTIPATTSPFAALKNLQVTVGNIPIWNNPVSFGYDLFVQEMSKSGVDGGLDDVTTAGLLNQRLWESLYRFVAVDIGRRLPSEDGAQKSIVISGTSNCDYALTIYYHVWREVVATVDTAMGTVSQGAVQH